MTNQETCDIMYTERGKARLTRTKKMKERLKTMTKTIYRVFHLNATSWIDERTKEHNDFDTLTEAINYRNEAKNYRDRYIDVVVKTFNPETFEYTEETIDSIKVD